MEGGRLGALTEDKTKRDPKGKMCHHTCGRFNWEIFIWRLQDVPVRCLCLQPDKTHQTELEMTGDKIHTAQKRNTFFQYIIWRFNKAVWRLTKELFSTSVGLKSLNPSADQAAEELPSGRGRPRFAWPIHHETSVLIHDPPSPSLQAFIHPLQLSLLNIFHLICWNDDSWNVEAHPSGDGSGCGSPLTCGAGSDLRGPPWCVSCL